MGHLPTRWNALVVVLALATMVGCQGLSTSKSSVQSTQNPLLGTLTAGAASVSFGNVQVGTSQTQSDTLSNTGVSNLTISQTAVTGPGFNISGLSLPLTLIPGQSTTFSVVFAPQSAGSASGTLALTNNGSSSTLSVALSGTAVDQNQTGTLAVSSVNVGSVAVGTSGTQTGTLSASGASVSVSSVSFSGTDPSEFSISGLTFPVTVTTTQPVTFTVKFTPSATGTATASASFASTASNTPTVGNLSGTGTAAQSAGTLAVSSVNVGSVVVGTSGTQTGTLSASGCERIGVIGKLERNQPLRVFDQWTHVPSYGHDDTAGYVYREVHARCDRNCHSLGFIRQYRVQYADRGKFERHGYGGPGSHCRLEVDCQHHTGCHQLQRLPRNLLGQRVRFLYERGLLAELQHGLYRQRSSRWHDLLLRDHGGGSEWRKRILQHYSSHDSCSVVVGSGCFFMFGEYRYHERDVYAPSPRFRPFTQRTQAPPI